MTEFRARLRIKKCLWVGCKFSHAMPTKSGRAWMLHFSNFPWAVVLDSVSTRILATRKYGEQYNWPDNIGVYDLIEIGQQFCISVAPYTHDGKVYIMCRLVL